MVKPPQNNYRQAKVTMKDVARLAGVSQGTVSRVLSNSGFGLPVSEETRTKVFSAVEQLNYQPNLVARSLRTQRTFVIAVMIADISNAFYHVLVRTVQDVARHHNYGVLIANTDQAYEYETHFCQDVMRRAVDGVIMVPFHLSTEEIDTLKRRTGAAIVALGQHVEHPEVDVAFADDEGATYRGVRYLIEKGHRHIGFIGVDQRYPPGQRRWRAYQKALADAGLPLEPAFVKQGDFSSDSGYAAMQAFIANANKPTAIFACNDRMAIGAIGAAHDAGIYVPDDIAIMGFDNIPEATLLRPHLTTIAQHPADIGRWLAQAVIDRIEGKMTEPGRRVEFPCEIIVRASA